ncbi:MAG: hypothetical protein K1X53_09420 [Candidatus Sumerlaeaceae bacterium]|nr:hypothetical protein [Candidatus Sumerlaeaceae bacterium]
MAKLIGRVLVLERHADGSSRQFTLTRIFDSTATIAEVMAWRDKKVHDPVNGEFASREVILTPDDADND